MPRRPVKPSPLLRAWLLTLPDGGGFRSVLARTKSEARALAKQTLPGGKVPPGTKIEAI